MGCQTELIKTRKKEGTMTLMRKSTVQYPCLQYVRSLLYLCISATSRHVHISEEN